MDIVAIIRYLEAERGEQIKSEAVRRRRSVSSRTLVA